MCSDMFLRLGVDMSRAYGSQLGFICSNGLKPVATICNEPTALLI